MLLRHAIFLLGISSGAHVVEDDFLSRKIIIHDNFTNAVIEIELKSINTLVTVRADSISMTTTLTTLLHGDARKEVSAFKS